MNGKFLPDRLSLGSSTELGSGTLFSSIRPAVRIFCAPDPKPALL